MSSKQRIRLADIAQVAGVHVTTVSMALRNHPRLPRTTKSRIQALARKMGYSPDPLLSALAAYRSNTKVPRFQSTIAYLTNWRTEWGWMKNIALPDFFNGAETRANQLGYKLEHFWIHSPTYSNTRLSKIFQARGISGVILAFHSREMGDSAPLDWSQFSCAKIDYFPHETHVHNVTNYQSDIVRLAMQKVMAKGYRRIGLVMHRGWDHSVDNNWTGGYLCEQQHIDKPSRIPPHLFPDLRPVSDWTTENSATIAADTTKFRKWLDRYKPDVVLSNAAFVLPCLKDLRIKVPEDLAFADLFLTDFSGATAGVRQNHDVVGALAVELVSGQIKHGQRGIPEFPTTTFVEGTWFDGESCPSKK